MSLYFDTNIQLLMRMLAQNSTSLFFVNIIYNRLNYSLKQEWHRRFAKIFRNSHAQTAQFEWMVNFLNKKIRIPFDGEQSWLDWDHALSILGHEIEIKQTYETFIKNFGKQLVFFDIGANYGFHSLLFLSQNIKTVSFEPNPMCGDYFEKLSNVNHLIPNLQPIAISDSEKTANLIFPKTQTWLGKTYETEKFEFETTDEIVNIKVKSSKLDSFVNNSGIIPVLIKIDTEGSELKVLKSGHKTISQHRPYIIFESFLDSREGLWNFFLKHQYNLYRLPILSLKDNHKMNLNKFLHDADYNYLASPVKI